MVGDGWIARRAYVRRMGGAVSAAGEVAEDTQNELIS
jgi:hypothetical protein